MSKEVIRHTLAHVLIGALLFNTVGSQLAAHGSEGLSEPNSATHQGHPPEHQVPGPSLEAGECCLSACCPGATISPGFVAATDRASSPGFQSVDILHAAGQQDLISSGRPSVYQSRAPPLI